MIRKSQFPVILLYICIDESSSMDGEKIQSLNSALRAIHEFVPSQPLINETVRIGVIGFSETAEVLLQITKMADVVEFPGLEAKGGTNYGNAFTCLKQTIQTDIAELKSQGYAISERPIVFFVSDGEPTDIGWREIHGELVDKQFPYWPHFVTFCDRDANVETLKEISTIGRNGTRWEFSSDNYLDFAALFKSALGEILYISGPISAERTVNLAPVKHTNLVPVYLVIDEAAAIDERSIHAINHHLPEIHKVILRDPPMNESVRLSVISFSDSIEVLLPLSNLSEVEEFPGLVAKGSADYQELFLALQRVLADDLSKLPQLGEYYARPIVFIFAASNPNDESWRGPHADLLNDPRFHSPHLVVLGAGESSASTMTDIATTSPVHHHRMAYRLTETSQPSEIVRESLKTLYFAFSQPIWD
jgi:uncharacterized protein YegL